MASNAYKNYMKNLKDVDRLIQSHKVESGGTSGKKGLGHLTRSGIVMLCAAFEVFIEEIVKETLMVYVIRIPELNQFPKQIRKRIAYIINDRTNNNKNELEAIKIAGENWKTTLIEYAEMDLSKLNTPKCAVIDIVVNRWIGYKAFSDEWSIDKKLLNDFVTMRGEVAHNGSKSRYVKIKYLIKYRKIITDLAQEVDGLICDYINTHTCCGQPWRKRYV